MSTKPYNGFPPEVRRRVDTVKKRAARAGRYTRRTVCEVCHGSVADGYTVHTHNEDYHRPLDDNALCFCCHMALHLRFAEPERWKVWCIHLLLGWRPPATNDYRRFVALWRTLPPEPAPDQSAVPEGSLWYYRLPYIEPNLYDPERVPVYDEGDTVDTLL